MLSRNQEQELIMKIIYNHLFNEHINISKDPKFLIEEVSEEPFEDVSLFVKDVVVQTMLHEEELLKEIEQNLHNWTLDRMNKVTIAIILFALAEARFIEGSIKAPIIDVAVSLSIKYCDDKDYRFVNAILDKLI